MKQINRGRWNFLKKNKRESKKKRKISKVSIGKRKKNCFGIKLRICFCVYLFSLFFFFSFSFFLKNVATTLFLLNKNNNQENIRKCKKKIIYGVFCLLIRLALRAFYVLFFFNDPQKFLFHLWFAIFFSTTPIHVWWSVFNGVANYVDDGKLINFNDFCCFVSLNARAIFRILQAIARNLRMALYCCWLNYLNCKFVAAQQGREREGRRGRERESERG